MAKASTDWAGTEEAGGYRACVMRKAGLIVVAMAAFVLAACSQSVSSTLPDLQPVNNVLTADQQKKAIDDLQARRDQQEAAVTQSAKTQR